MTNRLALSNPAFSGRESSHRVCAPYQGRCRPHIRSKQPDVTPTSQMRQVRRPGTMIRHDDLIVVTYGEPSLHGLLPFGDRVCPP